MSETRHKAVAIVGVGAILPDAPDVASFWDNLCQGRYAIRETPVERWDPAAYWDPDPRAPDRTYSKIGGWVDRWAWDPLGWRLPLPPRVVENMDRTQIWAVAASRQALVDYGFPERPLDRERTAVILGNAMAGDRHYFTALRLLYPEYARQLEAAPSFAVLPDEARRAIADEFRRGIGATLPVISEDTMPGEIANIIAGRVANLFDFHGPNYVCDAACASALAAMDAAIEGLAEHDYDAVLTGGIDANMSASTFIKFSKIGALSATGTRPYGDGADGFVMGEGAAVFLLKRLADAERDGDRVYAVLRGVGGSSDGRGKGITAPNPVGQRLAVERAWRSAGESPATVSMVEGHGTSTKVGDVVEVECLTAVFGGAGSAAGGEKVALGSVKSNIGHLKGAAGAAGLLKATLALHHGLIPPSLGAARPNPAIDLARTPFYIPDAPVRWERGDRADGAPRRAGVSAFGFGGTNFHAVLEEWQPGRLVDREEGRARVALGGPVPSLRAGGGSGDGAVVTAADGPREPLRGALVLAGRDESELIERLRTVQTAAANGEAPPFAAPAAEALRAPVRLAIDYGDAAELAVKAGKALRAYEGGGRGMWRVLRAQGIFRGEGPRSPVAFLYTGQGSQYPNMLDELRRREPVVEETFAEADAVMTPLLGRPLSEIVFAPADDPVRLAAAEAELRQTAVTQPAVLTVDVALTRLLATYGMRPDFVIGHSLGEYGALVAAGCLPFAEALEAVSARGQEMTRLSVGDSGRMVAVFGSLEKVEAILAGIDGYVVVANLNSSTQAVIGGASDAVERATAALSAAGLDCRPLPVSHAFHTRIVAPASQPLARMLGRLTLRPPQIPVVSNATGDFYPMAPGCEPAMIELLARQIAEPVQFLRGLERLHEAGARVFVEVGPKRALQGFVEDVLGGREVLALYTNHPKTDDATALNGALCGLYASGHGIPPEPAREPAIVVQRAAAPVAIASTPAAPAAPATVPPVSPPLATLAPVPVPVASTTDGGRDPALLTELGRAFADFLDRGLAIYRGGDGGGGVPAARPRPAVVVTGAAVGLPGTEQLFDDRNVGRLLRGEQLLAPVPARLREEMVAKRVTRLVKSEAGGPRFEVIADAAEVIKLAARAGDFDLARDFGLPADRLAACDRVTMLAIGAGIDALRDAGIPLVLRYKTTTTGGRLPDRWMLPESMRDSTGIVFASAFPGYDQLVGQVEAAAADRARRARLAELVSLRAGASGAFAADLDGRIAALEAEIEREAFAFDRRFLFQVLAMGHAQFAETIGARGPNIQINSACASTTQAFAVASDWIESGRCERVVVIAADDVTSDRLFGWFASGFLATGAAATDARVEDAALPFDRRRHGMLIGMGAAAAVLESASAVAERGLAPICEVLGTVTANSAYHGTRLDVRHIGEVMERLVAEAEARHGLDRHALAGELLFVSHETYTPARGGSAQAEIDALRRVFGADADRVVIANTKGYTGHPMGVGIEDVLAVKALETGLVPPVPNLREIDPDLGPLHLSRGGRQPVRYALRLGAGFGSQVSMSLLRWVPTGDGRRRDPEELGHAYRVADPVRWRTWLAGAAGIASPELEVVKRTLRVRDTIAGVAPGRVMVGETVAASTAHAPAVDTPPPVTAAAAAEALSSRPAARVESAARPTATAVDAVQERVLALVVEKTGYPAEMLALDLDLEADLGIDTVKQAELFASIREAFGIERDANLKLRDYPTLAKTIEFVHQRRPDLRPVDSPPTVPAAPVEPAPLVQVPDVPGAPPAPAAPTGPADEITSTVLDLVSEKTGYPPEMLELDLDLEADLGIDTVKQAELFAAVRERYAIERDPNLKLKDYPTLAATIGFVRARRPDLAAAPIAATAAGSAAESPAMEDGEVEAPAMSPAAFPRRIPVPVLRPALDLCHPTGVELGSGQRVLVVADAGGVAVALAEALVTRGVEVVTLAVGAGDDPMAAGTAFLDALATARAGGPLHGLYWLPALDPFAAAGLAAVRFEDWRQATAGRVKLLAATLRELAADCERGATFVVVATRLGGALGYGPDGAAEPVGGAVVGLVKAFAREVPAALVKVVDVAEDAEPERVAADLIGETLRDAGVVEVGRRGAERLAVAVVEQAPPAGAEGGAAGIARGAATVYVVTGAAGAIVSAIVEDLATTGGTYHLLDLAPAPAAGDPDLAQFADDRDGLRRRLAARLTERGERATPVAVERELAAIERRVCAARAMDAIVRHGGRAIYHQVNLCEPAAVDAVAARIAAESGRVDVLVHAAGLEVSRRLGEKSQAEFDRVFDVKADGWFNLLHALAEVPLGAAVVFSSIAGRFGNAGQTDYAAANELLAKSVLHLPRWRPGSRGLVLDWSGWGEIGMASRGSIPQLLAAAGIDLLPSAVAIPVLGRELTALDGCREVVVAGRLGSMLDERRPGGGVDLTAFADRVAACGPMVDRLEGWDLHRGVVATVELDPRRQPFLDHHRIDGTAVLPGVMGIEAFVELASLVAPGRAVVAVEEVAFLAPFKLFRDEPRRVRLEGLPLMVGDELLVACRLVGERLIPGQEQPQRTLHFTGCVRLLAPGVAPPLLTAPAAVAAAVERAGEPSGERAVLPAGETLAAEDIYRLYFHGPAYQVLARAHRDDDLLVGLAPAGLPTEADRPTQITPRAVELAFQTAGVADLGRRGVLALPSRLGRLRCGAAVGVASPRWAVVQPSDGDAATAWALATDGSVQWVLEGYRTIDLGAVGDDETVLAPFRALIEEAVWSSR